MKIVLLGYMGSGKSTIARLLSSELKIQSFDLDQIIEKNTGFSVKQIFSEKGEVYFRKLEHETLVSFMQQNENYILSLGGGTPCYYDNMAFVNAQIGVKSIYLNVALNALYERLIHEKSQRPLIASLANEELKEFLAKHLFERNPYYNQALLKININNQTPNQIVDEILSILV
jgi:shikimate kinase